MVRHGWMHNYLRMYWAKKILEWTPDVATAMKYAIYLNDQLLPRRSRSQRIRRHRLGHPRQVRPCLGRPTHLRQAPLHVRRLHRQEIRFETLYPADERPSRLTSSRCGRQNRALLPCILCEDDCACNTCDGSRRLHRLPPGPRPARSRRYRPWARRLFHWLARKSGRGTRPHRSPRDRPASAADVADACEGVNVHPAPGRLAQRTALGAGTPAQPRDQHRRHLQPA